jgi:hypothetical protein
VTLEAGELAVDEGDQIVCDLTLALGLVLGLGAALVVGRFVGRQLIRRDNTQEPLTSWSG